MSSYVICKSGSNGSITAGSLGFIYVIFQIRRPGVMGSGIVILGREEETTALLLPWQQALLTGF